MSVNWDAIDYVKLPIIAGTISEGMAREFIGYCRIYEDLPTIAQMLANPGNFVCPTEPSIRYAIINLIANHFDDANAHKLIQVLNTLPKEFQLVGLKRITAKNKLNIHLPEIKNWVRENQALLIDN